MHASYGAFASRVGWMLRRYRLISFSNPVRQYASSVEFVERELELKPFWKLKAILKNVSLDLGPTLEEKFLVRHAASSPSLSVEHDYENNVATVNFAAKEQSKLTISMPYHVNLEILLEGSGDAKIADVENETVQVKGECYDVELNNVKSNSTSVVTDVGTIRGVKTLRGNLDLESRKGNIIAQKLQSFSLSLSAKEGFLATGDVYAQQLTAFSDTGVRIKSAHGCCDVESNGDIIIGTADGEVCLLSRKGNVHTHFAEHARSANIIANTGDVNLSFSPGLQGKFCIEALHVNDDSAKSVFSDVSQQALGDYFQYKALVGDGTHPISVKSRNGVTVVESRSWLEAVLSYDKKIKDL